MLLKVDDIYAAYGAIEVVHGASFQVDMNQCVALVGPNGSGKTTLMKIICGALKPTSGKVIYQGDEIQNCKIFENVKRGITLVPEGRLIFYPMTVRENLEMGAVPNKDKEKVKELMDYVFEVFPRLYERRNQIAGTMSGGEQQMLAIGRGIMANPKILLLDEPSLGLAPVIVQEVYRSVQAIRKATGISVLLVEQSAKIALAVADYAYVIENGRVAMEGTAASLNGNPEFIASYFGG